MNDKELMQLLHNEAPILEREIRSLFSALDKKTGLNGATLPIEFVLDEKVLGAYVPKHMDEPEHFNFSLLFIGYALNEQITREERDELYKHEYAHYMTHYINVPKEFTFKAGVHGSAFIYCCSIIGANPDDSFTPGQKRTNIDYEALLTKKKVDHNTVRLLDQHQQEKQYQANKNRQVKYQPGDVITHPKFGNGTIKSIEQLDGSVRLNVEFPIGLKAIDQAWLEKQKFKKSTSR